MNLFYDEMNKVLNKRYTRTKDMVIDLMNMEEDRSRGAFLRQQFEKESAEQEEFERSISFPEFTVDDEVIIYKLPE